MYSVLGVLGVGKSDQSQHFSVPRKMLNVFKTLGVEICFFGIFTKVGFPHLFVKS